MKINSQTRLCLLIGNPVEHSVSPSIHNAGYRALGLNYAYLAFRVEDVRSAVDGIRGLRIRGASVTMPYKQAVIPYLDQIDPLAKKIGAVNTIVNDQGRLTGYNTDGLAAYQSLVANRVNLAGARIALLGAGGAARAIAFTLASKRKSGEMVLMDLQEPLAAALAREVSKKTGARVRAASPARLVEELETTSVLINATPIGMYPKVGQTPVPKSLLRKDLAVFDIVYNPFRTRLLKEAASKGAKTIGGLEMLARQACEQFKLFTGKDAPFRIMLAAGRRGLRETKG
jgi:shikimate dehydrogenase